MVSVERQNELLEAYRHYTACGIIVHPLTAPKEGNKLTGKSPVVAGYNVQKEPYTESFMLPFIKNGCNLGIVCGRASDITVLDVDWWRQGLMDYLFDSLDTSKWCKQNHGNGAAKGHFIFRFVPNLIHSLNHELGFDILAHNLVGKSNNCVCSPSIHYSGEQYRLNRDISERTEMPEELVKRIKHVINLYDELKDVLRNCRAPFRMLWEDLFMNVDSEIYRRANSVFRQNKENRDRCLGMFTELKANGATDEMLLLGCMLAFGDDYDLAQCRKEMSHLDKSKTWTNTKIQKDPIMSKYYHGLTFDPFTAPLEKMEKMLKPEALEAYESIMITAPIECLDIVRRAFLVGVATKQGYITEEEEKTEGEVTLTEN